MNIQKMSHVDQLLQKNQEIYKNLRKKLEGITKAQKNIADNLTIIKPLSYGTRALDSIYNNTSEIYQNQITELMNYNNGYSDNKYQSSPIQTQRALNESLRKRLKAERFNESKENLRLQSSPKRQQLKQNEYDFSRNGKNQRTFEYENQISEKLNQQVLRRNNTLLPIVNNSSNLRNNSVYLNNQNNSFGSLYEKELMYNLNKTAPIYFSSLENLHWDEVAFRKKQIQRIYQQLRNEQEQIEKAYQEYKKQFIDSQINFQRSKVSNTSFSKSNSRKKIFRDRSFDSPSKMSSISKNDQSLRKNDNLNNTTKNLQFRDTINESEMVKNERNIDCSPLAFQNIDFPNKPESSTAKSHIFIPFNKLYKSPILQMKSPNVLILARKSKLNATQKTQQCKIVDGKKIKFSSNIQTDQQNVIKKVLHTNEPHNIIAIVGGQNTLKKKLHMGFIAHAYEKLLQIVDRKQFNHFAINISYCEYFDKSQSQNSKIQNTVEIGSQKTIKISVLKIQKTIQEIYEAIKKIPSSVESSFTKNPISISQIQKQKILKFTRLTLLTGNDCIWSCHILSTNQYNHDFLKTLGIRNIIWSINPLVKNYEEVTKTLDQLTKYEEAKSQI